jgi:hypothetical protein
MAHPLVDQLRFARSEFQRGLIGLTEDEAQRRFGPMNCIAWNIGHLAWQEQRYWLIRAQDVTLLPELNERFRNGGPATVPTLAEAQESWRAITAAADPWLDAVTPETLLRTMTVDGRPTDITFGSMMLRTTYHYWFHNGENAAIRQHLGHADLPQFVGDIDHEAPYRPL